MAVIKRLRGSDVKGTGMISTLDFGARRMVQASAIALLVLGLSLPSNAANWYVNSAVATSGNGQSWSTAWKAFTNISWSAVQAGDTIYISGGSTSRTYSQTLTVGKSGSATSPIRIARGVNSGHNGIPIINGAGTRSWGVLVENDNHIVLSGLEVRNHTSGQIRVRFTPTGGNVRVENNVVFTGNGRGIDVRLNEGVVTVAGNRCTTPASTASQTDCFYSSENRDVLWQGNFGEVSNDNTSGHSDVFQSYQDYRLRIIGNTFISPPVGGHNKTVWLEEARVEILVANNVVVAKGPAFNLSYWRSVASTTNELIRYYNNTAYGGTRALAMERAPRLQMKNNIAWPRANGVAVFLNLVTVPAGAIDYNMLWAPSASISNQHSSYSGWRAAGRDPNGLNANPLFVSPGTDFHLQTGSQAIDAGTMLAEVVTYRDGAARPQGAAYDMGAYEVAGTLPPPDAPTLDFTGASFSWQATNADSCVASGAWSGSKPVSGSQQLAAPIGGQYVLNCTGPGGQAQRSVTITVSP